jgi:long-chain fatty acid transport protein
LLVLGGFCICEIAGTIGGSIMGTLAHWRAAVAAGAASAALAVLAGGAEAGGFAIREQSATLMGAAFAGAAAGGDLSSSFWNPAAFSSAGAGLNTQSSYTVLLPESTLSNGKTSVDTALGNVPFPIGGADSTDIDKVGFVSSTYGAYRLDSQTVFGVSLTAPFGLATEPSDLDWTGRVHSREAEMITFNASPTVAYEIIPGVQVAAGIQIEYMRLKLWSAAAATPGAQSSSIKVDDTASFGATAGLLLHPFNGTSVGVGFRSSIAHHLDGKIYNVPGAPALSVDAKLETPEMVTASISQVVMPGLKVMGNVEWTNWSRIGSVPINGTAALTGKTFVIDANWDDGWFFSGGVEYDYSPGLTVRAGGAFEKSPIQDPTQRLSQLPDSDRVWATVGATYHYSEWTTIDFAYAHLFFDDAHLHRGSLANPALILDADVETNVNIVSLGLRTKW